MQDVEAAAFAMLQFGCILLLSFFNAHYEKQSSKISVLLKATPFVQMHNDPGELTVALSVCVQ